MPEPIEPSEEAVLAGAAALHADWEPEENECDGRCWNDAGLVLAAALPIEQARWEAEARKPSHDPFPVPWWAILDVWMALGGKPEAFDRWVDGQSRADRWAQLLAWIRREPPVRDTNPPAGPHPMEAG